MQVVDRVAVDLLELVADIDQGISSRLIRVHILLLLVLVCTLLTRMMRKHHVSQGVKRQI